MDILSKLFGSRVRVKIMRLFLLNPDKVCNAKEVATLSHGSDSEVARTLSAFMKIGLIRRRRSHKEDKKSKTGVSGWMLDQSFVYLKELRDLVMNGTLLKSSDIVRRLGRGAHLKLVILSGVFIRQWDSRIDLLVVGDKLKRGILERVIRSMESDIGRELRYSILETADFRYRLSVGDKLVRDVFDFPHHAVLDKLVIEPQGQKQLSTSPA